MSIYYRVLEIWEDFQLSILWPVTFETFDQSDEETWHDQQRQRHSENTTTNTYEIEVWNCCHFRQLRTWVHDNHCNLGIKSDTLDSIRNFCDVSSTGNWQLSPVNLKSVCFLGPQIRILTQIFVNGAFEALGIGPVQVMVVFWGDQSSPTQCGTLSAPCFHMENIFRFFSVLTAVTWEFSKPLESRTRRCLLLYYIHHPRHSTSPTFTTPDVHHPCRTDGVYEDWDDCWYWWQRQLTPFSMWKTWPASLGRWGTWSSSLTSWSTPASSTRTTPREAMQ